MYSLSFEKLIACCKDIYGRSCIPKSDIDQFYPQFAIIIFNGKSS